MLDGDPIEVDQSALTGESLPATRKPGEAVFSGSIVRLAGHLAIFLMRTRGPFWSIKPLDLARPIAARA